MAGCEGGADGGTHEAVDGLQIVAAAAGGATRITARGELDGFTAESLRAAVDAAEGDIELDLEGVTFIDSSGLASILEAHLVLGEQDRRLTTVALSPVVQRLLAIAGLEARLAP